MKKLEYIIFACCIYDYEHFSIVKSYGDIFFELKEYYEALKEAYENHDIIDEILLNDYIRKRGLDYNKTYEITKELDYENNNFKYYLNKYLKEYQSKRLEALYALHKGNTLNIKELHEEIENILTLETKTTNILSLEELLYDKALEEKDKTVDVGIEFFKPEGGFRCGEVVVIGARPSIGKTTYMLNIAIKAMINNYKILMFSAEMKRQKMTRKIISILSGVNERLYSMNQLDSDDRKKVEQVKEKYKKYKVFMNDTPCIDIEDLCMSAKQMKKKEGIDIIFIDYLGLLSSKKPFKYTREKFNYFSDKLKYLARILDIPIVVLAQLGRQSENRTDPIISDLKESGKIEEDGDVIILLKNEEWVDEIQKTTNINKNIVGKNRNGRMGMSYYTRFERITGYMWDTTYSKI